MEMKETELLELIATGKKVVVDVWMDNCPFCDEYAPTFEKVAGTVSDVATFAKFNLPPVTAGTSEFKKKFMKVKAGEKLSAPATLIFENGELKYRHFGKMDEAALVAFVLTGEMPVNKMQMAGQELLNLFARRGEITFLMEELPGINARIIELQRSIGIRAN